MKKRGLILLSFIFLFFIFIGNINAVSQINFNSPTLNHGTNATDSRLNINFSIVGGNIREIKFGLNNVNETFYDNNLVLMYNLDNLSLIGENNTLVADLSWRSNNGTTNATWNATSRYRGGFEFNGINDNILVADDVNHFPSTNKSFSVRLWFKSPRDLAASGENIIGQTGGAGKYNWIIGMFSTGTTFFYITQCTSATTYLAKTYQASKLNDTLWHYFAGTYNNETAKLSIYVDGFLVGYNDTPSGVPCGVSAPLKIGGYWGGYGYFNGSMDEIKIWNKSLSEEEIYRDYISDLNKYDADKWNLSYSREKWNLFYPYYSGLTLGINTFFAYASNSSGIQNITKRNVTLLADIPPYYDNRKAAVVVTTDDYGVGTDIFDSDIAAINSAQQNKIVISPAVHTNQANSSDWAFLQEEIDEGYVFPSSHSVSHQHPGVGNDTFQVCDSRIHIIQNLTLPWQDWYNGSEYMVGWVAPFGESNSDIRSNLSFCNYLNDRNVLDEENSWAFWDNDSNLYSRYGSTLFGDYETVDSMNANFTEVYDSRGIYHLWFHPYNFSWAATPKFSQHFSYIGNKTDIWYVGWGELYMYHYLEDKVEPTLNITYRDNNQILSKINTSGAEREKYGLSYPMTYSFYLPEQWQYAFAFYKNASDENYTAMIERTRNESWAGIDAFRQNITEHAVYISKSFPQTSNELYLKIVPILSTSFDSSSTDLTTNLTALNMSNITNLVLEKSSYGKIVFSEPVNLSTGGNLDRDVIISRNSIYIDTGSLPSLDKGSTLSFYGLSFSNPRVLKDGVECPSSICGALSYSGGIYSFTATSFSNYSLEEIPLYGTAAPASSQNQTEEGNATNNITATEEETETGDETMTAEQNELLWKVMIFSVVGFIILIGIILIAKLKKKRIR